MEHLPSVSAPFEPILIPYLGGRSYDGLTYPDYPTRCGWDISRLLNGDLQGRTREEASQFLQTWLYFGMLHETFRLYSDLLDQNDFIRVDSLSGMKYVTTAHLPEYFVIWLQRINEAQDEDQLRERVEYYTRFRSCMQIACKVWNELMVNGSGFLDDEVLLSIQVLAAALDVAVTDVCANTETYTWRVVPRSSWLMERMIRQGWCPCIVEQLSRPCATFLYYASLLGPPKSYDHSDCRADARACVAANVKEGLEYVSKHVDENCLCDFVVIDNKDRSDLCSFIEAGAIPVICLDVDGTNLSLQVVSHHDDNPIPYTAISHVWSDGMGDPTENRLLRCQIIRLAALLKKLPSYAEKEEVSRESISPTTDAISASKVYFWMDTMCVPVNNSILRQKAISQMSEIYKSASNVLVLNSELMRHPSLDRSYTEIYTRISCSTWLRRLWTLQEATLNPNVLIQFSDRALYAGRWSYLHAQYSLAHKEKPWDLVSWECNRCSLNLLEEFSDWNHAQRTNLIWNALKFRTTSRKGDEPLCIAILLELDVNGLQDASEADAVKKFWQLHEKFGVPAQVLFIPGRKLKDKGLGWAPEDLMDLKVVGGDMKSHGRVTTQGLRVTYPGFLLEDMASARNSVISCVVDDRLFFIRLNLSVNPPWEGLNFEVRPKKLAVILQCVRSSADIAAGGFEAGLGILVEVLQTGEEIFCKYLRLTSVVKKGDFMETHPIVPWSDVEIKQRLLLPVSGAYLHPGQKWCVD